MAADDEEGADLMVRHERAGSVVSSDGASIGSPMQHGYGMDLALYRVRALIRISREKEGDMLAQLVRAIMRGGKVYWA